MKDQKKLLSVNRKYWQMIYNLDYLTKRDQLINLDSLDEGGIKMQISRLALESATDEKTAS